MNSESRGQYEAFDAYVKARAVVDAEPADASREETDRNWRALREAIHRFLTTPATMKWSVYEKFSLFEREGLDYADEGAAPDRRALQWFASLKADAVKLAEAHTEAKRTV